MMSLCDSMGLMVVKKTRMVWVLLALFLKAFVASRTMIAPGGTVVSFRGILQTASQAEEIFKAAEMDNSAEISSLLSQGVASNFTNALGMTPLLTAAALGNAAACKALISGGADVNVATLAGYTALHFAVRRGDIKIAKMLIEAGADVNRVTKLGLSAVVLASKEGYINILKLLLASGAKIETEGIPAVENPLITGVINGKPNVVRILVEEGADVSSKAPNSMTALHFAAWPGNEESIPYLMDGGADIEAKDGDGYTPLAVAAISGNSIAVGFLLRMGAKPTATNSAGLRPIDLVCSCVANPQGIPCDIQACQDPFVITKLLKAV